LSFAASPAAWAGAGLFSAGGVPRRGKELGAGWMLCVRAEDALAAAAAAAAASDKMRSVTLSAPAALWLPPAICKHASSGQVLESCSNLALLLLVCACAGAGRSRGRCGGWPAAAGGGRAARRVRGAAAAARRRAALGLVLSSLMIKVPSHPEASLLPHYCNLSESVRQFLCHSGSSFEDFLLREFRVLYFRQAVCSRSVFGGPDDMSLSPLLIALTGSSLPL